MTLKDLETSKKEFLSPADVSSVLGCHPYSVTLQARENPEKLGFPVTVIGTRTYIPRIAFIKFVKGDRSNEVATN